MQQAEVTLWVYGGEPTATPRTLRRCDKSPGHGPCPARHRSAISGVVAFSDVDLLQRGRPGPDNDPGSNRSFAKFGLAVRARQAFQIHVAGESQANALIDSGKCWVDRSCLIDLCGRLRGFVPHENTAGVSPGQDGRVDRLSGRDLDAPTCVPHPRGADRPGYSHRRAATRRIV